MLDPIDRLLKGRSHEIEISLPGFRGVTAKQRAARAATLRMQVARMRGRIYVCRRLLEGLSARLEAVKPKPKRTRKRK